jgi:hypothetical protein
MVVYSDLTFLICERYGLQRKNKGSRKIIKTTSIIIISKEGAGKGTLMQLSSKMLGESKILETKTMVRLHGRYKYSYTVRSNLCCFASLSHHRVVYFLSQQLCIIQQANIQVFKTKWKQRNFGDKQ